jgi:hypothetical protein
MVFDGLSSFSKIDQPLNPKTEYGKQKAEAEKQLLSLGKSITVVRFTKIIGFEMTLLKDWIRTLKSNEISTIVEEGAISQTGTTLVSFDAQFTLPSTKVARQKVTPEPLKPKASVSEYDLGQIVAGQAFKRNIAELAIDDDEGDILVFKKAGGPSFIDVTPDGSITAIPTPDNIGKFVIEIEVKDLDGEVAVASFYGEVVKSRNTAPRWKGGEK